MTHVSMASEGLTSNLIRPAQLQKPNITIFEYLPTYSPVPVHLAEVLSTVHRYLYDVTPPTYVV